MYGCALGTTVEVCSVAVPILLIGLIPVRKARWWNIRLMNKTQLALMNHPCYIFANVDGMVQIVLGSVSGGLSQPQPKVI